MFVRLEGLVGDKEMRLLYEIMRALSFSSKQLKVGSCALSWTHGFGPGQLTKAGRLQQAMGRSNN